MNSRQNAWRHGLSVINRANPVYAEEIAGMAEAICGHKDCHPLLAQQAVVIAECAVIIRHVDQERIAVIKRWKQTLRHSAGRRLTSSPAFRRLSALNESEREDVPESVSDFEAMQAALPELLGLDRYERRAWSRLKRATLCLSGIRAYLRAIAPKSEDFDIVGCSFARLPEPEWKGQVIDSVFRVLD
jgi:hypothetical protein